VSGHQADVAEQAVERMERSFMDRSLNWLTNQQHSDVKAAQLAPSRDPHAVRTAAAPLPQSATPPPRRRELGRAYSKNGNVRLGPDSGAEAAG